MKSQILTNEQLEKKLIKSCCGQEMILVESHLENSRICYKYACSQCNSSLFDYGEKPKKAITLTAKEYENFIDPKLGHGQEHDKQKGLFLDYLTKS